MAVVAGAGRGGAGQALTPTSALTDNDGMDRPAVDLSAYDEARAEQVARDAGLFCADARTLVGIENRAVTIAATLSLEAEQPSTGTPQPVPAAC